MEERENGYYWVKIQGNWFVGLREFGIYLIVGLPAFFEGDLDEIGEQVKRIDWDKMRKEFNSLPQIGLSDKSGQAIDSRETAFPSLSVETIFNWFKDKLT